ncbi:2Fe-2S iron-sulfur cluster-binding protein [Aquibacillus albus]|uniref:Ferredoxin n=1 Tax=Aquibacillus albus TaxID=1168171 RepID=A0ABS2MXI7_9BACI|nr:2Fe-2S iron-sulfur cluster-binding protein [Aquibacillus albus]MBM7570596.1 ferredoxin [Aquibacillus albus]
MDTRRLTVGSLKERPAKPSVNVTAVEKGPTKVMKRKKPVPSIKVLQNNSVYKVIPKANQTLLDTALNQDQMLSFKCKKGTCGKCMVKVLNGMECLREPTIQEDKKLETKLNQGYRLACQAVVKGR